MVYDRRCDHHLLSEERIPVSELISLDALRDRIPKDRIAISAKRYRAEAPEQLETRLKAIQDPFDICVILLATNGSLPLYVVNPARDYAHRIRLGGLHNGCCGSSLIDWVRDGRFSVLRSRMRHQSLEALLDGLGIYIRIVDVSALELRPAPAPKVKRIIQKLIDDAKAIGMRLTRKAVLEKLRGRPDTWGVSPTRIKDMFDELKPKEWRKPGRPSMTPRG